MLVLLAGARAFAAGVAAEGPKPVDQLVPVSSRGPMVLDAGLVFALPSGWQTGLSSGAGAGARYAFSWFSLGARASWSTSTESSLAWAVTHDELRVRFTAGAQRQAGRGAFGLRLGLGPTFVHEKRVRNQGMRAGLSGSDLATSALATLPVAELAGVVSLHVGGPWLLVLGGGPSWLVEDGRLHTGWITELAIGWQP